MLAPRGRAGGTTREELDALGDGGRTCRNDFKLKDESASGRGGESSFMGDLDSDVDLVDAEDLVQENNDGRFSLGGTGGSGGACIEVQDWEDSFGKERVERALLGSA